MRTTVRLSDSLLRRAKREAVAQGRTLTSLMEEGLLLALDPLRRKVRRKKTVLPTFKGDGLNPDFKGNINCMREVLDYLDAVEAKDGKDGIFKC